MTNFKSLKGKGFVSRSCRYSLFREKALEYEIWGGEKHQIDRWTWFSFEILSECLRDSFGPDGPARLSELVPPSELPRYAREEFLFAEVLGLSISFIQIWSHGSCVSSQGFKDLR